MPWLITYEGKVAGGYARVLENLVTHDDPLVHLCELQQAHPDGDYVLVSAVSVKSGPHVDWIINENSGEPHGDALGEPS